MLKISENIGTWEIGLVTPTPERFSITVNRRLIHQSSWLRIRGRIEIELLCIGSCPCCGGIHQSIHEKHHGYHATAWHTPAVMRSTTNHSSQQRIVADFHNIP